MSTGYTAGVEDGTVTDFRVFALLCARAFGACVEMRDESLAAKIPDEFKPSSYHDDRMKEFCAEAERVRGMTDKKAHDAAFAAYEKNAGEKRVGLAKTKLENKRFRAMMAKVADWTPPTKDHAGMKDFMLEQLRISLHSEDWSWFKIEVPTSGEAWRKKRVAEIEKDIDYHRVEHAKEVLRCAERTAWVRALKESLISQRSE